MVTFDGEKCIDCGGVRDIHPAFPMCVECWISRAITKSGLLKKLLETLETEDNYNNRNDKI